MIGQSQKLNMNNAVSHFKSEGIDLSSILYKPKSDKNFAVRNVIKGMIFDVTRF